MYTGLALIGLLNSTPAQSQKLSGVIVSAEAHLSRALVIHNSAISVRHIGAPITDSDPRIITEITHRYIVLDGPQGPQRWYLGGQSESTASAATAGLGRQPASAGTSSRGPSNPATDSPADGVEQASARVLQFDHFVAVEWFARTGRGKGLKISDAINGAWLERSELRVNDVITQVDGELLSTPAAANTAWSRLATKDLATLDVRRGNQTLTLTVDLRLLLAGN